jgi:hypothetical protein
LAASFAWAFVCLVGTQWLLWAGVSRAEDYVLLGHACTSAGLTVAGAMGVLGILRSRIVWLASSALVGAATLAIAAYLWWTGSQLGEDLGPTYRWLAPFLYGPPLAVWALLLGSAADLVRRKRPREEGAA